MIEVEKKFQPTEQQLTNMLEGAEFVKEKNLHDLYYDYADLRLYKKELYLRKRDGKFELKIGDNSVSGVSEELEGDKDIVKYLKINQSLQDFVDLELQVLIDYKTTRREYKKEGFIIDVDELSDGKNFHLKCIEIELQVGNHTEVDEAKEKITNFASKFGFENQKSPPKRKEYFRIVKPEVYNELYEKR